MGANSLLSCIFSGLIVAPGIETLLKAAKAAGGRTAGIAVRRPRNSSIRHEHDRLLKRPPGRRESVSDPPGAGRRDDQGRHRRPAQRQLEAAIGKVERADERAKRCSLSDTGNWTNQNVVFTKALLDMFPLALTILKGALAARRMPRSPLQARVCHAWHRGDRSGRAADEAEKWCDRFEENTRQWLKSTIATYGPDGEPQLTYEDVDTSLIPPRPRLYGLVGAEEIEKVWKERQRMRGATGAGQSAAAASGNGEKRRAECKRGQNGDGGE